MFDNITSSLTKVFDTLSGKKMLSEEHIDVAMREVRVALLEADVSLNVSKEFISNVKKKALGQQVIKKVNPTQMIIKIVNDELVELLGSESSQINLNVKPPLTLLMVGLQGAGKTSSCGKLAYHFNKKKHKKRILLASLDNRRPAAQKQLEILATQAGVDSLEIIEGQKPKEISKRAMKKAQDLNYDILILDSAGRNSIDDELMAELQEVKKITKPDETLLVVDALIGQDAIHVANNFKDKIGIDGVILTRIDGDSRGGAAITMKFATGCPIKFLGVGEKIDELDTFDPERIASRILGMGDVVSLVEKAQESFGEEEMRKAEKKLRKGKFDLNDLASQLKNMKKMGGMSSILKLLPGAGKLVNQIQNSGFDEKELVKQESLIMSMTFAEREKPDILSSSRKRRVAAGAGSTIQEVNRLLKKYKQMQKMVKKVGGMDKKDLMGMIDGQGGGAGPAAGGPDLSNFLK
jgi:signal recognition particle subunit SRP54